MRTLAACLLLLGSLVPLAAAEGDPLDEQIAQLRQAVREDRVAVVRQALPLSAEQASTFWPLYLEHQAALDLVRDRRLHVILDFTEQKDTLTDEQARALMLRALDVKRDLVATDREWMEKMLKVLPGRMVGRYFQIENKIDALINLELAAVVPLAPTEAAPAAPAAPAKP